jgi:hypothetical protein
MIGMMALSATSKKHRNDEEPGLVVVRFIHAQAPGLTRWEFSYTLILPASKLSVGSARHFLVLLEQRIDRMALEIGPHDLEASDVFNGFDLHRMAAAVRGQGNEFRANAELGLCPGDGVTAREPDLNVTDPCDLAADLAGDHIHAGRADKVADKGMGRLVEQLFGRSDLDDFALVHHHNFVGESQRLGLVVCHVDHGVAELAVQILQLGPQLPLHVRIDHRQRLVEQDRIDVVAHQPAAQRDLLLLIGGEAACPAIGLVGQIQHLDHVVDALGDLILGDVTVDQGKGQVLAHRHGVVDDRKLEHLGDVCAPRAADGSHPGRQTGYDPWKERAGRK